MEDEAKNLLIPAEFWLFIILTMSKFLQPLNCLIYKTNKCKSEWGDKGTFFLLFSHPLGSNSTVFFREYVTFYILHEMPSMHFFPLVAETQRKPSNQQIQGIKSQRRADNRDHKSLFFLQDLQGESGSPQNRISVVFPCPMSLSSCHFCCLRPPFL